MEVSNEIKEDIRKTQTDLKNAIRIHQVWITRLRDDENNIHIRKKIKEAERNIVAIGQSQKRVVDRLRKELELYQQRLKARNRQVNIDNDNQYIAQQLREHQIQFKNKSKPLSILKPSVLNDIHSVIESNGEKSSSEVSDEDCDIKPNENYKENSNSSDSEIKIQEHLANSAEECRKNLAGALLKVRDNLMEGAKVSSESEWMDQRDLDNDSNFSGEISPSPPPPELPPEGESVDQELFLGLLGLLTQSQKEYLEKKRLERRKRSNKGGELNEDDNIDIKRKKLQFSYLQTPTTPPETRSAKQKKEQKLSDKENSNSREPSPSTSPPDIKTNWDKKPEWQLTLPEGLTVVPVYPDTKKACHSCGEKDVPSLLVECPGCTQWTHTGCGAAGRCGRCGHSLPDPAPAPASPTHSPVHDQEKRKLRQELQEKNIQLCMELQRLLARADVLKENLIDRHEEKNRLLNEQIKTQQDLQKLLDFVNQFRESSLSIHTPASESGSEKNKSSEE